MNLLLKSKQSISRVLTRFQWKHICSRNGRGIYSMFVFDLRLHSTKCHHVKPSTLALTLHKLHVQVKTCLIHEFRFAITLYPSVESLLVYRSLESITLVPVGKIIVSEIRVLKEAMSTDYNVTVCILYNDIHLTYRDMSTHTRNVGGSLCDRCHTVQL